MSLYNASELTYEEITVLDQPALFSECRINRASVPDGMYRYELRHGDENWGEPVELARGIMVNFYGTVLTREPFQLPTLSDVKWDSAAANTVDGYELAIRYTATATYTGTATSSYATGYIATANYVGEITKSTSDTVIYTAVFAGEPKSSSSDDTAGGIMDNLLPDTDEPAEDTGDGFQFNWKWLAIPIAGAIAVGGYFGYKYYLDKKRGYK